MKVSVIIAAGRSVEDVERTVRSIGDPESSQEIEIVVVGSADPRLAGITFLPMDERNPAIRRNRGVAASSGGIVAFIDDDATADQGWIDRAVARFRAEPDLVALGGPDPAPLDSSAAELLSDTLLRTPWIGSGVRCHECDPNGGDVTHPHELALVNLFVRREAFDAAEGFDERIGYIGEDTALLDTLMSHGRVAYDPAVVVRHRRRAFPLPYLRQRWRYRVKTGERIAAGGSSYLKNPRIVLFLLAGIAWLVLLGARPLLGIGLLSVYVVIVLILGIRATRLGPRWWPVIPAAFALHHGTYFCGILAGIVKGSVRRIAVALHLIR